MSPLAPMSESVPSGSVVTCQSAAPAPRVARRPPAAMCSPAASAVTVTPPAVLFEVSAAPAWMRLTP